MFGSFLFESEMISNQFPNYVNDVVDTYYESFKEKLSLFKRMETSLLEISDEQVDFIIRTVCQIGEPLSSKLPELSSPKVIKFPSKITE